MSSRCPADLRFERLERLLRGELGADDAAAATAHAQSCEICRAERAALLLDRARLASAAAVAPGSASALRAHEIVARARQPERAVWPRVALLAGAAGAVAIVAVLLLRPDAPPARRPPIAHRTGAPTAEPRTSPPAPAPLRPEVVLASGMPRPTVAIGAPIEVPEGARLGVRLADGTALALAGGTRATLRSREEGVVVDLARGEVECLVAKQGARAFSVRAPGVEALVHGTRFIVRAASAEVFVLEGRVEVRRPGSRPALVDAGPAAEGITPSPWLEAGAPCGARAAEGTGELEVGGTGRLRVDGMEIGPAPAILRCVPGPHRVERVVGTGTDETLLVVAQGTVASLAPEPLREARPEPAARAEVAPEPAPAAADLAARARQLLAARRYDEARTELQAWLAAHPGDLAATFLLGEAQRLGGDASAAERTFERVVERGSGLVRANALTSLAFLAERRGPAAALAAWDRYLAAQPRGNLAAEATLRRANALVALGRHADARGALERFLRDHPNHPRRAEVLRRLEGSD